ncbi:hypothetical protein GCM10027285_20620 [Oleiagrimonas citrea]
MKAAQSLYEGMQEIPENALCGWLKRHNALVSLVHRDRISALLLERVIHDPNLSHNHALALWEVLQWSDVHQLRRLIALRPGSISLPDVLQHFRRIQFEAAAPVKHGNRLESRSSQAELEQTRNRVAKETRARVAVTVMILLIGASLVAAMAYLKVFSGNGKTGDTSVLPLALFMFFVLAVSMRKR